MVRSCGYPTTQLLINSCDTILQRLSPCLKIAIHEQQGLDTEHIPTVTYIPSSTSFPTTIPVSHDRFYILFETIPKSVMLDSRNYTRGG